MAIHDDRAPQADLNSPSDANMGTAQSANVAKRSKSRVNRRWLQLALVGGVALTSIAATGCTTTSGLFRSAGKSDIADELITKYRNRVTAEKAWHCRKASFGPQAENDVFKAGFIAGYLDIAEGGKGCTPLVAPREYWGWRYQSAAGQNAAGSWFGGFPIGVQAAEEDGLGTFQRLPFCDKPSCTGPECGGPVHGMSHEMDHGMDDKMSDDAMMDDKMMDGEMMDDKDMMGDDASVMPSPLTEPKIQRGNPFDRPVRPIDGDATGPAAEQILPPAPDRIPEPAANPFGNEVSQMNSPMSGGGNFDGGNDFVDAPASVISPSDMGVYMAIDDSEKLTSVSPASESAAEIAAMPTDPTQAEEQSMTIEEIFGITDEQSDGVEVQFDDLPFSFE